MVEPFFAIKLGPFSCFCLHDSRPPAEVSEFDPRGLPSSGGRYPPEDYRRIDGTVGPPGQQLVYAAGSSDASASEFPTQRKEAVASTAGPPPSEAVGPTDSELQAAPRQPDFSGSWLCVDIQGDIEAYVVDMGVPFLMRKAAKLINYGKGMGKLNLVFSGDQVQCEEIGLKTCKYSYNIDNTWHHIESQTGPLEIQPYWDLERQSECRRTKNPQGKDGFVRRFFADPDTMVQEMKGPSGTMVQYIWKRQ